MDIAAVKYDLTSLLADYCLPSSLGFGETLAPIMVRAEFRNGQWQDGEVVPFADVAVNPASTALQFAQQAFEGMKAYQVRRDFPTLFRPDMNYRRFNRSGRRLCMPTIPPALFAEALSSITGLMQPFIPGDSGQSLYLRPTMFGLDPHFAVKNSDRYVFLLLASPSDAYYSQPIRVLIERDSCRTAIGGTGAEKVGGNYGATLQATERCVAKGFHQSLWLDPTTRTNVEELSAMNFVAVIDGKLHMPSLSGSILDGVTRNSLLHLARHRGMTAIERTMPVDSLLGDIDAGRCSEAFACGTGAIICPIAAIGDADGTVRELPQVNQTASQLKSALLDIQEGRVTDPFDWVVDARDVSRITRMLRENGGDEIV